MAGRYTTFAQKKEKNISNRSNVFFFLFFFYTRPRKRNRVGGLTCFDLSVPPSRVHTQRRRRRKKGSLAGNRFGISLSLSLLFHLCITPPQLLFFLFFFNKRHSSLSSQLPSVGQEKSFVKTSGCLVFFLEERKKIVVEQLAARAAGLNRPPAAARLLITLVYSASWWNTLTDANFNKSLIKEPEREKKEKRNELEEEGVKTAAQQQPSLRGSR